MLHAVLTNFTYYAHVSDLCIGINHAPYATYYADIMLHTKGTGLLCLFFTYYAILQCSKIMLM